MSTSTERKKYQFIGEMCHPIFGNIKVFKHILLENMFASKTLDFKNESHFNTAKNHLNIVQ